MVQMGTKRKVVDNSGVREVHNGKEKKEKKMEKE